MNSYDEAGQAGNWTSDGIWSLGAPPTASDDAFIGGAGDFRVTSDQSETVNSIGVASGEQLEIGGGSTLTAVSGTVLAANDQGHSYGIDGIVYVDPGATFSVGDAVVNFDSIDVDDGTLALTGAVSFVGIGTINLGVENTIFQFTPGDINGGDLSNEGNTIQGGGRISVYNLDNAAGAIIAQQEGGDWLDISTQIFTNEAAIDITELATLDLGADGATQSLTNTGTVVIGYSQGGPGLGQDATLAISGNYTINGTGQIDLDADGASIVSDLSSGDTFTNGGSSSIRDYVTGQIGNGSGVAAGFNLTFVNDGAVYATGTAVTLTINTGANTVSDPGGLMEADDYATLILDSPIQMGVFLFRGISPPPGGTIEATTGGSVDIYSTVASGPPSSSGQVVADVGSVVWVESGGSVSAPIVINGSTGLAFGVVNLESGGAISGEITFNGPNGVFDDYATNAATYDFAGGGGVINFASHGDTADIANTGGVWDVFHGSRDTVSVNAAQASVIGRADTISATAGSLVRLANTGVNGDAFTGSDDVVRLYNAQVTLNGASDTIHFQGSDAIVANGQSNAFVFGEALGVSSITGFQTNERLRLSAADWSSFSALQASHDLFQSGNNTVIEISASDMLTLVNTQVSQLSATNVKFQ
jgi:hypothetical protein